MRDIIEDFWDRHWASYFYSGSIALIVSWVLLVTLSGCRIGNHVDNGSSQDIGATGYYSTRPTSFTVKTSQTTGGNHILNMSVASVPGIVSDYFTDPTTLYQVDGPNGKYAIFPPGNPNSAQAVYLSANGKAFSVSAETGWQQAWTDPACQMDTTYTIIGTIDPLASGDPTSTSTSIGRIPLTGRLAFRATYETSFQGDCSNSWQALENCYQSLSSCPGSTAGDRTSAQQVAQSIYNYWVQVGALDPSEINVTSDLRFDVSYQ